MKNFLIVAMLLSLSLTTACEQLRGNLSKMIMGDRETENKEGNGTNGANNGSNEGGEGSNTNEPQSPQQYRSNRIEYNDVVYNGKTYKVIVYFTPRGTMDPLITDNGASKTVQLEAGREYFFHIDFKMNERVLASLDHLSWRFPDLDWTYGSEGWFYNIQNDITRYDTTSPHSIYNELSGVMSGTSQGCYPEDYYYRFPAGASGNLDIKLLYSPAQYAPFIPIYEVLLHIEVI
jgi:hypothetical protein